MRNFAEPGNSHRDLQTLFGSVDGNSLGPHIVIDLWREIIETRLHELVRKAFK